MKNIFSEKRILLTLTVVLLLTAGIGAGFLIGRFHGHEHAAPTTAATDTAQKKQLWTCGMHPWIITEEPGQCPICGMDLVPKVDPQGTDAGPGERKIAYWRAPMDPTEVYDHPGKSKMGMDLVPVYEDQVTGGVEIRIDPATRQNMGVRTARAETAPLVRTIRTYGHVTYDETRTYRVSPKVSGWLEKVAVDFTGRWVEKGEILAEIYSPELLTAQEEFLAARDARGSGPPFADAARRRLLYWDVPPEVINELEKTGRTKKSLPLRSPFSGVLTRTSAVAGGVVNPGQILYEISDLSKVWVEAHIFEYELPWIRMGQTAEMTLPYQPGIRFTGKVAYIYPYLQKKTRDVVIRLEFDNPDLSLKPDMYADIEIRSDTGRSGTVVPAEAVIRSGIENLVFVAAGEDRFLPRKVRTGLAVTDDRIEIIEGVAPGETVVVSGQFLLDSESKLKEAVAKMLDPKAPPAPAPQAAGDKGGPKAEEDFFSDM